MSSKFKKRDIEDSSISVSKFSKIFYAVKENIELPYLILVFFTLLYFSLGNVSAHLILHNSPVGHFASDSFQHITWAEWIKTSGNYRYGPPSLYAGYTDVVGHYPFMHAITAASLSLATGFETYDTMLIISYLLAVVAGLIVYLMVRRVNKIAAILSLPFIVYLFADQFKYIFVWGQYAMLAANFFAVLMFWSVSRTDLKYWWVIFGISTAASFQAHPPEMLIAGVFCATYLILKIILEKKWALMQETVYSGIVFLISSFNYIIIFLFAIRKSSYGKFSEPFIDPSKAITEYLAPHTAYFGDFGIIIQILIIVGILSSLYIFFFQKRNAIFLLPAFMLAVGFLNYAGGMVGGKVIQQRYYWAVFLAQAFGFAIFQIINFPFKKFKRQFPNWVAYLIAIPVFIFLVNNLLINEPITPGGIYVSIQDDKQSPGWTALEWIKSNTPPDAEIFYFFDTTSLQESSLAPSLRNSYALLFPRGYDEPMERGNISRYYYTKNSAEAAYDFPYRKSLFSFGFHEQEYMQMTGAENQKDGYWDICSYDYYVLPRYSYYQQTEIYVKYSMLVVNLMMQSGMLEVAHNDEYFVIIKNNFPGSDCLPSEGVQNNETFFK